MTIVPVERSWQDLTITLSFPEHQLFLEVLALRSFFEVELYRSVYKKSQPRLRLALLLCQIRLALLEVVHAADCPTVQHERAGVIEVSYVAQVNHFD